VQWNDLVKCERKQQDGQTIHDFGLLAEEDLDENDLINKVDVSPMQNHRDKIPTKPIIKKVMISSLKFRRLLLERMQ
jgi:hypothetical protein